MIRGDAHDLFFNLRVISEGITDDCCRSNRTHADIWHFPNCIVNIHKKKLKK